MIADYIHYQLIARDCRRALDFIYRHVPDLVNATIKNGLLTTHPLHIAAAHQKASLYKYLVRLGANMDQKDSSGKTPDQWGGEKYILWTNDCRLRSNLILYVLRSDQASLSQSLDEDPKRLNMPVGNNGETLLHVACYSVNMPMISFLHAHGANVEAVDGTGRTPLEVLPENIKALIRETAQKVQNSPPNPPPVQEAEKKSETQPTQEVKTYEI